MDARPIWPAQLTRLRNHVTSIYLCTISYAQPNRAVREPISLQARPRPWRTDALEDSDFGGTARRLDRSRHRPPSHPALLGTGKPDSLFHDNAYSPDGDKYVFNRPSGIMLIDLGKLGTESPRAELVVPNGGVDRDA